MADRKGKSGSSNRFYFLGPQITVDGDCIHEIKRHLLLGRKTMTNLDSVLKSRDIIWQWTNNGQIIIWTINVHIVKVMVFPVVMYGYKSLIIKNAENQRTDVFE